MKHIFQDSRTEHHDGWRVSARVTVHAPNGDDSLDLPTFLKQEKYVSQADFDSIHEVEWVAAEYLTDSQAIRRAIVWLDGVDLNEVWEIHTTEERLRAERGAA